MTTSEWNIAIRLREQFLNRRYYYDKNQKGGIEEQEISAFNLISQAMQALAAIDPRIYGLWEATLIEDQTRNK